MTKLCVCTVKLFSTEDVKQNVLTGQIPDICFGMKYIWKGEGGWGGKIIWENKFVHGYNTTWNYFSFGDLNISKMGTTKKKTEKLCEKLT